VVSIAQGVRYYTHVTYAAYTTKKGYENWATPLAEVDLKVGGFIKSNYNKEGKIGYKNNPKYISLMNYFIPVNEKILMNLIMHPD
jgi:hypothetical protein